MRRTADVCVILTFVISVPVAIVAWKQLYPNAALPSHWPFVALIVGLVVSAGFQLWAAVLNHKKPRQPIEPKTDDCSELKKELAEIYADCILDWLKQHISTSGSLNADDLAARLRLTREQILSGIARLEELHLVRKTPLGWNFIASDAVSANAQFKRLWTIN